MRPSLDALLFDLGGTLDGTDAWRDRFHRLFAGCGLTARSRDAHAAAFDHAERRAHQPGPMASARLRDMLRYHVAWQCESLGVDDPALQQAVVDRFAGEVDQAVAANRRLLAALAAQGLELGVVSNGCGNVAVLCAEYGYAPSLSAIVDSHRFGAAKPDPAIFRHALDLLGVAPSRAGFVGDSLDRDIEPARSIGMRTFWIANRRPGNRAAADVVLTSIAELPASLRQVA